MFTWLTGSKTRPPYLLRQRSSKTYIIATVSTAVFTDIFAYGIIVPVLPFALASREHIDESNIQSWISILLAVYGGALLVSSPFCGWLADRMSSRRVPMLGGLVALCGSTVMLCIGNSIAVLCAGRVLQGLSASVVWVVGLAIVVDTVGPDAVGQMMGYMGLSMSFGVLLAPLLAGVVFEKAGYNAVFAMVFGLIVLDIFLRLTMIERKVALQWLPQETTGVSSEQQGPSAIPTAELASESGAIELNATQQSVDQQAHEVELANKQELVASDLHESKSGWTQRLPPVVQLLASRRMLSSLWACMIQATLLTSFDSILPLYVKTTFHWNSIGAGLIFLPLVTGTFIGPVVGNLSDKYGPRSFATAGFLLGCPLLILLRLVDHDSIRQKVLLCALLVLIGFSLSCVLTPMMAEISYCVAAKEARRPPGYYGKNGAYAQAYSLFNTAFAGGSLIGPLLAGLVNQSHGWKVATLILGCVSIFTALPTVIWSGGSIWKLRRLRKQERNGDSSNPTQPSDIA